MMDREDILRLAGARPRRLQRVDELTGPPVVGQMYLVPGVIATWYGRTAWWPIVGPYHEDARLIGFPYWHYHIDGRFLDAAGARFVASRDGDSMPGRSVAALPICDLDGYEPPTYRRRKCRSQFTGLAVATVQARYRGFPKLIEAFATSRLKRGPYGWVCPHKGVSLAGCPAV